MTNFLTSTDLSCWNAVTSYEERERGRRGRIRKINIILNYFIVLQRSCPEAMDPCSLLVPEPAIKLIIINIRASRDFTSLPGWGNLVSCHWMTLIELHWWEKWPSKSKNGSSLLFSYFLFCRSLLLDFFIFLSLSDGHKRVEESHDTHVCSSISGYYLNLNPDTTPNWLRIYYRNLSQDIIVIWHQIKSGGVSKLPWQPYTKMAASTSVGSTVKLSADVKNTVDKLEELGEPWRQGRESTFSSTY